MGSNAYDNFIEGKSIYAIDVNGSMTSIASWAFYRAKIWMASFPNVVQIGSSAFYDCTVKNVNFSNLTSLEGDIFYSCTQLSITSFPKLQTIEGIAFAKCTSLAEINLPLLTSLVGSVFYQCEQLISLYLLGSQFCSCSSAKTTFLNTPMYNLSSVAGRWGSIFIPASRWTQYRNNLGWSWVWDRFVSVNVE